MDTKRKIPILTLGDIIAVASPPGLFLGRIANFINGELWGTPTASFFGMLFPGRAAQDCPVYWLTICTRHPTQLYEAIFGRYYPRPMSIFLLYLK